MVQQVPQFASATIEITGSDQSVQLTLRPALNLKGKLQFDTGARSPALENRRVPWRSMAINQSNAFAVSQVGATNKEGNFTVTNVSPGSYLIGGALGFGPTSDTMTWALQSVVIDDRDVTDIPVVIDYDHTPKDVTVTYTDKWQGLTGRLTKSNVPAPDYTVVVFPADKSYWLTGSRRIIITRPATDGRFVLSGPGPSTLPPGDYLIAAVTDLDRDEQFDPSFLSALIPSAVHLTVHAGEKRVQDLSIH
jgi:hypothetical protein